MSKLSSRQVSQTVLYMRPHGEIFSRRTSAPDQCGSSTAPGRNDSCRSGRCVVSAFRRWEAPGIPVPGGSLPGLFTIEGPGAQGSVHGQTPCQFNRSASQLPPPTEAIAKRLCLPGIEAQPRRPEPATWPSQVIRRFQRSSLRVIQTVCARPSLPAPIAFWFLRKK